MGLEGKFTAGITAKRLLTPSQWLPKPATRWVPQTNYSLREVWSSILNGGEGKTLACGWFWSSARRHCRLRRASYPLASIEKFVGLDMQPNGCILFP